MGTANAVPHNRHQFEYLNELMINACVNKRAICRVLVLYKYGNRKQVKQKQQTV